VGVQPDCVQPHVRPVIRHWPLGTRSK